MTKLPHRVCEGEVRSYMSGTKLTFAKYPLSQFFLDKTQSHCCCYSQKKLSELQAALATGE